MHICLVNRAFLICVRYHTMLYCFVLFMVNLGDTTTLRQNNQLKCWTGEKAQFTTLATHFFVIFKRREQFVCTLLQNILACDFHCRTGQLDNVVFIPAAISAAGMINEHYCSALKLNLSGQAASCFGRTVNSVRRSTEIRSQLLFFLLLRLEGDPQKIGHSYYYCSFFRLEGKLSPWSNENCKRKELLSF